MSQLRTLFNVTNKIIQNSQVGNYFPPKIYADVQKMKYQRQKKQNKYKKDKAIKKIDLNCKKHSFLEQIEKRQKKLPSPNSYKPVQYESKYKSRQIKSYPSRVTIFAEQNKQNMKNPIPSPCHYKMQGILQKIKPKSNSLTSFKFSKAENNNFLDGAMYNSSQNPGIGQYNVKIKKNISKYETQNKLGKFDKAKRSQSLQLIKNMNLPSSFTYEPKIPNQNLFSQIQKVKPNSSNFNKEKRFLQLDKNKNKNLYYAGISQWGLKTDYKKKDLLDVLSKHNIYSKSVYYH